MGEKNEACQRLFNCVIRSVEKDAISVSYKSKVNLAECRLNGNYPLHLFAAYSENFTIFSALKYLVKADSIARNDQEETPLIVAMKHKNHRAAELLLRLKEVRQTIDEQDSEGHSALSVAAEYRCGACYQLLLDFGAKMTVDLVSTINREHHNHRWSERSVENSALVSGKKGSIQ